MDPFLRRASAREHRQAELFFADLLGRPLGPPRRLLPAWDETVDSSAWSEAVAMLPEPYREAVDLAQEAEEELDAETVDALTFDLLAVQDQAGLDEFVGKLARTVKKAARDVSRTKLAKTLGKAATDVGKGVSKVGRAVPLLGTIAKLASRSPMGALVRATYGAVSAALRGQNIFMGALDGLAGTPLFGALVQMGVGVLRGENLLAAAKMAAKAGIADVREAVRFAAMVAPFVPGIGTGVGAALGAADALASGQPITQALLAGVRGAIPGGAIAQAAFDTAAQLAQGKRLDQALLTAARNRLPPGPAQAAFDTGLSLAQGKKIQDAMVQGAGRLLPASPYSADALSFARRALAGDNLGHAALSTAGNAVLRRVQQQGGDLVATVQGRVAKAAAPVVAKAAAPVVAKAAAPVVVKAAAPVVVKVAAPVVVKAAAPVVVKAAAPVVAKAAAPVVAKAAAPVVTKAAAPAVAAVAAVKPRPPATLEQAITAADLAERRQATLFMSDLAHG